jgi:hypothetical protein
MASINTVFRNISAVGLTIDIILDGDAGEHVLSIRSDSDTAFNWTYQYTQPDGEFYRYRGDEFLHNEAAHGSFEDGDIFHVTAMCMAVKERGKHFPAFANDIKSAA